MADSLPERVTQALVTAPVCAMAAAVRAGASSGAAWASLGGLPLLPRACEALRPPPPGASFRDYGPGLAAWRAEHGRAAVAQTLAVALVAIPLARKAAERAFDSVGQRALRLGRPAGAAPTLAAARKWREACWKLLCYGGLTTAGLLVAAREPWARDTHLLWAGWPEAHHHPPGLRRFYAWQMGHYLYGMVDQLVWESRRKDHLAMLLHHFATFALLAVSFHFAFLRVGAVIEVLHDACDVWMEAAKLCNYARLRRASTVLFLVFLFSWLALRMTYFPFVVIRSTSLEASALLEWYGPSAANRAIWAGFNALLLVLQALHVYWFYFIALIAVRALCSDGPEDARSDDEDDEEGEEKPKAAKGKAVKAAVKGKKKSS
jgi:ceramide synthetase